MFSREESKQIRQDFWIFFGKRYDRMWLRYNTGIKDVSLKFDFTTKRALVALDIEHSDDFTRAYYWDKILSLKNLLKSEVHPDLLFDENYVLDNGKSISRCYLILQDVSIHNKKDWPEVFEFFYETMSKLELFYLEYQDFIKE